VYINLAAEPVLFTNSNGKVRVAVDGYDYGSETTTLQRLLNAPPRPDGCYRIALVHAMGWPKGGNFFGHPTIGYNELANIDYDIVLWGHDHRYTPMETVGAVTHIHPGSLARAALEEDQGNRQPIATVLSFTERGVRRPKEVPIPCQPLKVAFAAADKGVANVTKLGSVTDFFSEMDEAVEGIQTSDPLEVLTKLCPKDEPHLLSRAKDLCEL
jgi:hypothetical protein